VKLKNVQGKREIINFNNEAPPGSPTVGGKYVIKTAYLGEPGPGLMKKEKRRLDA